MSVYAGRAVFLLFCSVIFYVIIYVVRGMCLLVFVTHSHNATDKPSDRKNDNLKTHPTAVSFCRIFQYRYCAAVRRVYMYFARKSHCLCVCVRTCYCNFSLFRVYKVVFSMPTIMVDTKLSKRIKKNNQ